MAQNVYIESKGDLAHYERKEYSYNLGQTWVESEELRVSEPEEYDSCHCSVKYQWVEDGTICDKNALFKRMKFQVNDQCGGWEDVIPLKYKIGDLIKGPADECIKVDWQLVTEGFMCNGYDKHESTYYYIKDKDINEWEKISCAAIQGDLIQENSFDCGWSTTKQTYTYEEGCGSELKTKYPTLSFTDTNSYKVTITHHWIADSENNTDADKDNLNYREYDTTYSRSVTVSNDCNCGYYTTQYDAIDEYMCGSELGDSYTSTTKYRKYIQNKYCGGNLLEPTGLFEWRSYQTNSCDCGYYTLQWKDKEPIETICGAELNNDPTDTWEYVRQYEAKVCGGNEVGITGEERWDKRTNKNTSLNTLVINDGCPRVAFMASSFQPKNNLTYWYAPTYYSDTVERYYYSNNHTNSVTTITNIKFKIYLNGVTEFRLYYGTDSSGWSRNGTATFYLGNIDARIFDGSTDYTSYSISSNSTTVYNRYKDYTIDGGQHFIEVQIKFGSNQTLSSNSRFNLYVGIDKSLYDAYYTVKNNCTNIDIPDYISTVPIVYSNDVVTEECIFDENTGGNSTRKVTLSNSNLYYVTELFSDSPLIDYPTQCPTSFVSLTEKSSSCGYYEAWNEEGTICCGADEITVNSTCTQYAKYKKLVHQYTIDNKQTWIDFEPREVKYGSLVETNSQECGYIPKLEQWVKICPDVTYENAEDGDGCTICQTYQGAPTMFAIEKKQYSLDLGQTWIDYSPLETRTEMILKWKAEKCGYDGDIFEERTSDEYCNGIDKVATVSIWSSSDHGETWSKVDGTDTTKVIEENSSDCIASTKWVEEGEICINGDLYAVERFYNVDNDGVEHSTDITRNTTLKESGAEVCESYITVDLNNQWQPLTYTSNALSGYTVYESFSNYNVASGRAKMKIHFRGYPSFTFKYRSDAESTYDYVIVGRLDTTIGSSDAYNSSTVQYYTRGSQGSWKTATYANDGEEHFIEIVYLKDSSDNTAPDKGFIAIDYNQ